MPDEKQVGQEIERLARDWNRLVRSELGRGYRGGVNWTWEGGAANVGFGVYKNSEQRWVAAVYQGYHTVFDVDYADINSLSMDKPDEFKRMGELERQYHIDEIDTLDGLLDELTGPMLKAFQNGTIKQTEYYQPPGRVGWYGGDTTGPHEYFLFVEHLADTQGPYYG